MFGCLSLPTTPTVAVPQFVADEICAPTAAEITAAFSKQTKTNNQTHAPIEVADTVVACNQTCVGNISVKIFCDLHY